jgi:hypothetical protein
VPKGGARINSGPPPDPQALRRDRPSDRDGWTLLPAGGYGGPVPEWPLLDDVTLASTRDVALSRAESLADELAAAEKAERARLRRQLEQVNERVAVLDRQIDAQRGLEIRVWGSVWRTPQAAVWAQQQWSRDVAQYVRHKVLGELGSLKDATEARQWSDRLGLNPAAMLRNRWRVAADEVAARRAPAAPAAAAGKMSARDRFKVVRDGGA